jgi:hypothetical protein
MSFLCAILGACVAVQAASDRGCDAIRPARKAPSVAQLQLEKFRAIEALRGGVPAPAPQVPATQTQPTPPPTPAPKIDPPSIQAPAQTPAPPAPHTPVEPTPDPPPAPGIKPPPVQAAPPVDSPAATPPPAPKNDCVEPTPIVKKLTKPVTIPPFQPGVMGTVKTVKGQVGCPHQ